MPSNTANEPGGDKLLEATKFLAKAAGLMGQANFIYPIAMGLIDSIIGEVKRKQIDPGPYEAVRGEAVATAQRIIDRDADYRERHPDGQ